MHNPLTYILFLLKSTNKHGVHSPFIYSLITECFNKKEQINLPKKERLLLQLINYFKPKNYLQFKDDLESSNQQFDYIYFDKKQSLKKYSHFEKCLSYVHNDSFLIYSDIHSSKEIKKTWKQIKQHPKVTVTVDVYYFGIVFFRKEQQKEHFILRV